MADEWDDDEISGANWQNSSLPSSPNYVPVDDGLPADWLKQIPEGSTMTQQEYEQFLRSVDYANRAEAAYSASQSLNTQFNAWYSQIEIWHGNVQTIDASINDTLAEMQGIRDATAADRVQTGLDRDATAADVITVAGHRSAVADDRILTEQARDTTLDYRDTSLTHRNAAETAAAAAAADRAQTSLDRDATLTYRNEAETLRDSASGHRAAAQSAATTSIENSDQTAADRVATGEDRAAAEAAAAAAATYDPAPFNAHLADTNNPHGVTPAQIGAQPVAAVLTNTTASYTTDQFNKLASIEHSATADQTPTEIIAALANNPEQARANLKTEILTGFRNKIINGNFDIWQRGVAFTSSGASAYKADRWFYRPTDGGDLWTVSRGYLFGQTDIPGNPKYYSHLQGGAGNNAYIDQHIEGVETLSGKRVTLTFYTLVTGAAVTIVLQLIQIFGTGGAPSSITSVSPISYSTKASGSWTRHDAIFDLPSVSGKILGTNGNDYLAVRINLTAPAAYEFRHTRVSLVEGDARGEVDPFSPRNIQQELALCQRYYWKSNLRVIPYGNASGAGASAWATVYFPVTMRATPTTILENVTHSNSSSLSGANESPDGKEFYATSVAAGGFWSSGMPSFDAEL